MKKFCRKPFIVGSIFLVVLAGALVLWKKPQPSLSVPSVVSDEPVLKTSAKDWAAAITLCNLEEGIQLARKRGELMRELIRTNPEQAVCESLSLSEWSALPPEIQAHVEQPFSAMANVEVMIACGDNYVETMVNTELPSIGSIETYVYGRRKEIGSKNGIAVQGVRVGNVGALRETMFQPLEKQDEQVALAVYPAANEDPGGGTVRALAGGKLFYFKSRADLDEANARLAEIDKMPGPDSASKMLIEELEAAMLGEGIDFQALEEMAIQAANAWTGTPRDMYVIMIDFPDLTGQPADPVAFSNSLNTTVSQQIWEMSYEKTYIDAQVGSATYRMPNTSTYYTNKVALLYTDATNLAATAGVDLSPYETICVLFPEITTISWGGLASINGQRLRLNGTTNSDLVIHELGHNYGSWHASYWEVSGSDPVDPVGTHYEYGDFMDIMGGGDAPEGHFNTMHKKNVGWLDAESWLSVTNSGTYRVYRSDHYQTTGLLRGLEIKKGNPTNQYWVGLRQEYGDYETFSRGAYLLWKKSGDNRSYLLDTSPLSAGGGYDGGLALGQTYSDAFSGVHITPTARGGQTPNEWMEININLGSFPGNSAPSASLNGPTMLGVQQSALFNVTASDVDSDELAYFWDIGDGLVKPNSPAIAAAWLTGGTATVSCVISDMKGGTNRVSQMVSVTNPTENWTQRTSGVTRDLMDIALGNGRLVIVADDETTLYSDDGINWTSHTSYNIWPGNVFLEAVTYDGSQFIAVGMDYDAGAGGWEVTTYSSTDGTYWTERYDSNSGNGSNIRLLDVAYGGGNYVAVGEGGMIVHSANGISWSPVVSGTSIDLSGVSYGDGTFVAVGAALGGGPTTVLTSSDGTSWSDQSSGVALDIWKGFYDVQYCNDRFLAGGWHAKILHSLDQGQTFSSSMTGNGLIISAFAYGDGTYFAAGLEKVYSDTWMSFDINLVSLDGESWTALPTASQDDRNAAVFFNGTFITVGANGSIRQSDAVVAGDGGFAVWQLENAAELGFDRDPMDDADFDGYLNLEEYARGTFASDAGSNPSDVVYEADGTYFQASYDRDGIKSDINYNVERATNLISNDWSSANTVIVEDSATNLTVRSAYTMSSQTNEFMHLELELQ